MSYENEESEWIELIQDNDYEIMTEEPFSIRKKSTKRVIAESQLNSGYIRCKLNRKDYLKHRIIAEMFIPNPENLPEVDHCNGIRNDNRLINLRWSSYSTNNRNRGYSSINRIKYNYLDEINEDSIEVRNYGKWQFEDLYFDPEKDTFYYFNGIRFREMYFNEDKRNGALFIMAFDINNKSHSIRLNKFKREYGLMKS